MRWTLSATAEDGVLWAPCRGLAVRWLGCDALHWFESPQMELVKSRPKKSRHYDDLTCGGGPCGPCARIGDDNLDIRFSSTNYYSLNPTVLLHLLTS